MTAEFDALFGQDAAPVTELPPVPGSHMAPICMPRVPSLTCSIAVNVVDMPDVPVNTVDDILAEVQADEGLFACILPWHWVIPACSIAQQRAAADQARRCVVSCFVLLHWIVVSEEIWRAR